MILPIKAGPEPIPGAALALGKFLLTCPLVQVYWRYNQAKRIEPKPSVGFGRLL